MRKSFFVLLFLGAGLAGNAQTMLKVQMTDNTPVNVSVDGRYFNKRGTSITVGDLPPGRHVLKIFAMSQGRRGRGYEDVIYEGKVKTHDGMVTILNYDPASQGVQVDEQDMNQYMSEHPRVAQQQQIREGRGYGNDNRGGYDNNYDNSGGNNGQYSNANNNQNYGENNSTPTPPPPTASLNDSKIDNLKTNVIAKATDSDRMKLMKDGLSGETFTTSQVGVMMDWFNFESSKVDFAEWAYTNTVDKALFSNLEAKLTYQNYRDDLDKFIKSK